MHPAFSIIIFTTLSGLGFGLAATIGLQLITLPSILWWIIASGLALALISVGIMSSTFHLGHPERAWRALSQWRSSWLSREGVLAAITSILLVIYAGDIWLFGQPRLWLGVIMALFCLATIWSTAMIYGSLKTVARWHQPLTPFVFLAYGLSGGFLVAATLDTIANSGISLVTTPAILSLFSAAIVGFFWSRQAAIQPSLSTPESATGLGGKSGDDKVRMLMPPHSEDNWLQREMGFTVARKHAKRLGQISFLLAIVTPILALALMGSSAAALVGASLSHIIGVFLSRWLFFAEAKHTVMLYYGHRH